MITRARHLQSLLFDDPVEAAERTLGRLRAHLLFRGCELGHHVIALGPVRVVARGRITLHDHVSFAGGMIPTELLCHRGALLQIGQGSVFNYGASLEAHDVVRLGQRCMVASMVRVGDRAQGATAPIVIGDDVWLAHGVIVEPGVSIGDRSVVSAGSVVTQDVPPDSLAVGNPARCLSLSLAAGAASHRMAR